MKNKVYSYPGIESNKIIDIKIPHGPDINLTWGSEKEPGIKEIHLSKWGRVHIWLSRPIINMFYPQCCRCRTNKRIPKWLKTQPFDMYKIIEVQSKKAHNEIMDMIMKDVLNSIRKDYSEMHQIID